MDVYRIELSEIRFYHDEKLNCKLVAEEHHSYDYRVGEQELVIGYKTVMYELLSAIQYSYTRKDLKWASETGVVDYNRLVFGGNVITEDIDRFLKVMKEKVWNVKTAKNGFTAMLDAGGDEKIKYQINIVSGLA